MRPSLKSKSRRKRKTAISEGERAALATQLPSVSSLLRTSTPILTCSVPHGQDVSSSTTVDTTSPLPGPITSPRISESASFQPNGCPDLWAQACKLLQAREPELMEDYMKHISTSESIESIVSRLEDDREKKQWQVKILGLDVKIRPQAERLFNFILSSNPVIKAAVATQPFATVAWTGVTLLLPVGQSSVRLRGSSC